MFSHSANHNAASRTLSVRAQALAVIRWGKSGGIPRKQV